MPVNPVLNLRGWFDDNKDTLKPPVGNKLIYEDKDWVVMGVGGPNSRKDYHYHHRGPEFFFMVKGDMMLKMKKEENGKLVDDDVVIKEGEVFMMPRETIHSPQRPAGTYGLVLEPKALHGEKDFLRWYCEKCSHLLANYEFELKNIVTELPPLMKKFFDTKELRTCKDCGAYMDGPKPFEMP